MTTLNFRNTNNGNGNGSGNGNVSGAAEADERTAPVFPVVGTKNGGEVAGTNRHRSVDVITRLRDQDGNRKPWFFAYHTPTVSGRESADTAMRKVIAGIRDGSDLKVLLAEELEHQYDDILLESRRTLEDVRADEEGKVTAALERAREQNAALDRSKEEIAAAGEEKVATLDEPIAQAHQAAEGAVAATGGAYDPQMPTFDCVLGRIVRADADAVAGKLRLPCPAVLDKSALPDWVKAAMTVAVGTLVGVSFLLAVHLLEISDLKSGSMDPKKWVMIIAGAGVGIGIAFGAKGAVYAPAKEAAKRYWMGRPAPEWGTFAGLTVASAAFLCYLDAAMEREGLMSGVRIQNALMGRTGDPAKEGFYLMLGLLVVVGYVLTSVWEGYVAGQRVACRLRIMEAIEARFKADDAAWRARPEVQAALAAIARVRTLLDERRRREGQTSAKIAEQEAKRLQEITELPHEAKQRIQEMHDQFVAAQDQYDRLLAAAKRECGAARQTWWERFRRLFGVRPAGERRRKRDEKRYL